MGRFDKLLKAILQHMSIDLRGRYIGMAKQLLNGAQIRAVLQQVTGEGVAQHVGGNAAPRKSCSSGQPLEVARKVLARQMPKAPG